jgi:hypothetical protein
VRVRDVCHGPMLDRLPDLWVLWRKGGHVRHVRSPLAGDVVGAWSGTRTGDHTPEGLLMARVPSLRAGTLGRRLDVMDLAPTLAAMLGVPLADVDGRSVAELLAPARMAAAG